MDTQHSWTRSRRGGGRRRKTTARQPYSWLGPAALTLGVGAALFGGAGIANADGSTTDRGPRDTRGDVTGSVATASTSRSGEVTAPRTSAKAGGTPRPAATVAQRGGSRRAPSESSVGAAGSVPPAPVETPVRPYRFTDVAAGGVSLGPQIADSSTPAARPVPTPAVESAGPSPVETGLIGGVNPPSEAGTSVVTSMITPTPGTMTNTTIGSLSAVESGMGLRPGGAPAAPTDGQALVVLAAARRDVAATAASPAAADNAAARAAAAAPAVVAVTPLNFVPTSMAVSPDGGRIYFGSSTVKVVDTSTNTVTGSISTGDLVGALGISPDGSRLYAFNINNGTVSVVDTGSSAVTATIAIGESWRPSIAVSPDNRYAYVTYSTPLGEAGGYRNPGYVAVIDTATNTVVSRIAATLNTPEEMVISPDGRHLYVQCDLIEVDRGPNTPPSYGSVSVIDTVSKTLTATITNESGDLQAGGQGLAISPDGTRLYLSTHVVDLTTNRVLDRNAPNGPTAISPDGNRMYVMGYTDRGSWDKVSLYVVDATTGMTVSAVPLNSGYLLRSFNEIATSASGKYVYTISYQSETPEVKLTVFDTGSGGGKAVLQNSEGDSGFLGDFMRGLGLAGFGNAIGEIFNLGHSPALGFVGAITDLANGFNQIVAGVTKADWGTAINGLLDVSKGLLGVAVKAPVGAVLSLSAQLIQSYSSFWVPIGTTEQENFLNFIGQCKFNTDTDNLSPRQAAQISDRYSGGWGFANLLSDYSNYKLRDVHRFFGQTGCP